MSAAVVAGPFAASGVSKTHLDNTSILQLLAERFGGPNEAYSTEVAGRMQHGIASVSSVLSASASNTTRLELSAPTEAASPSAKILPNRLHKVFDQGVKQLVSQHQSVAFAKFPELRSYLKA